MHADRPDQFVTLATHLTWANVMCFPMQYSAAQFLIEVPYMLFMSVYYSLIVYAMVGESSYICGPLHVTFLYCMAARSD
jgi:hypothetical protein